jgi:hypothetical protein
MYNPCLSTLQILNMNAQQMFDRVADHLATQQVQASGVVNGSRTCRYRIGSNKCAIGALIPDELYDPIIEGNGIGPLMAMMDKDSGERAYLMAHDLKAFLRETFPPALRMLAGALQTVHDDVRVGGQIPSESARTVWFEGLDIISTSLIVIFVEERLNRLWGTACHS